MSLTRCSVLLRVMLSCRCSIQQQQEQLAANGFSSAAIARACAGLQMPKPDVGPYCKATIGLCLTLSMYMAACAAVMQRLIDLQHKLFPGKDVPQQLADEVSTCHYSFAKSDACLS